MYYNRLHAWLLTQISWTTGVTVKAISSRLIEKLSQTVKDKLFPSYCQALL